MEEKVFRTTEEQISILKGRNLIINDDASAIDVLQRENYYNLVNGYKDVFLVSSDPDLYRHNTTFDELYALYLFDRELRSIFIKYILIIENHVKSVLAHEFSSKYGHKDFLKIGNFRNTNTDKRNNKSGAASEHIGNVTELICNIQQEIARQLKKNSSMIAHYMLDFGYVPLWVLVNTLSLGTISKFYSYLKQEDQNNISRNFKLYPDVLGGFLSVLTIFRNACAHDERFFSLKTKRGDGYNNNIKSTKIHEKLNIEKQKGDYIYGKNDLLAVVIIFKYMLTGKHFEEFYGAVSSQINILKCSLKSISISEVLFRMGFVGDYWDNIKDL